MTRRSYLSLWIAVATLGWGAGVQAQNQGASGSPTNQPQGITVHEREAPSERSDDQILKDLRQRLASDRRVPAYEIVPGVSDGVATLDGKVDNLLAKERAGEIAKTIPGIREIQNNVQVAVPRRQDWEILVDVKEALRVNPAVNNFQLESEAKNGIVILSGEVNSPHRKYLAETLVKAIKGVIHVENEIKVDLLAKRTDEEIRTDVLSTIQWDPWLKNPQVDVDVKGGVVVITGVVESAQARERILKDAEVIGTQAVDVRGLKVVPGLARSEGPLQPDPDLSPTGRDSDSPRANSATSSGSATNTLNGSENAP